MVHNINGWGYGPWVESVTKLGVEHYGSGAAKGVLNHKLIPARLSTALAMVHLKSCDSPGYAMYEALAAACPLIVSEAMVRRNLMYDLFENGKTCLVYEEPVNAGVPQIADYLKRLGDQFTNEFIGIAGRDRLANLMWREDRDGNSFRQWFKEMFGV